MTAGFLAVAVTGLTLGLIVARPRQLNEGVAALIGAALVLVLRLVTPGDALIAVAGSWNVFLFFLGMMTVAALADQSGIFDLAGARAARLSRGRVLNLYIAVFGLGTAISVLFANDSTALVLTPIVYAIVVRLDLDPLPFVFATTFVADTASVALPVSNPLNVIVSDSFRLTLGSYASHLWLPAILVVLVNLAVFLILFRRSLTGRFDQSLEVEPVLGLASILLLLGGLAAAYLVASTIRFPLGIVAIVGAMALAINLRRLATLDLPRAAREVSWPIFGFIAGMLVVVRSLQGAGVTAGLGKLLAGAAGGSSVTAAIVGVVGTAVGSNVINNLPMALVMTSTVHPLHVLPNVRLNLIYATILGCDLGPNLTHLGSLATLIWLLFLRRKGLDVSTFDYFRIGIIVTPIMLLAGIVGLWLTS